MTNHLLKLFVINLGVCVNCWNPTHYPFLPASTDITHVRQFVIDAQGKDKNILDIGCGTGYSTSSTEESLGIDTDIRKIKTAKKLFPNKNFKLGVIASWNRDKKYDVVTSMFYFHTIPRYSRLQIIKNAVDIAIERVVIVDISPDYKDNISLSRHNPFIPDYIKTCRKDLKCLNFIETSLVDGLLNIWILEK